MGGGSLPPALPCGHLLGRGGNIALRGLFQLTDTAVEVDEPLGHDVRQVLLVEVVGGVDGLERLASRLAASARLS